MKATNTLGILREVKNKWERRVPVTPIEVKKLVDANIRVLIQPCERRIFKDIEYTNAGAILTDDLSHASCILGVKEFHHSSLLNDHTYMTFSHVIKAQEYNMKFLDTCLEKNVRLIDYEGIKDDPRKPEYMNDPTRTVPRLVGFGKFAGLAGMITGLRGLGEQLLALGASTPFLNIASAYMYDSLDESINNIKKIGQIIEEFGIPKKFGPMTFIFTGNGQVTQGALDLFKYLPHEMVEPQDLPKLEKNFSNKKVYGCILPVQGLVAPLNSADDSISQFDKQDYYNYPEKYKPIFHSAIAPYTRVLVNGMYWDGRFPRLLTKQNMSDLRASNASPYALLSIFDITCDIGGSIEFTKYPTSTESPFMIYDPFAQKMVVDKKKGDSDPARDIANGSVLICAIDALPAELPREASMHFSNVLSPFLVDLARSDYSQFGVNDTLFEDNKENDLPIEIYNSVITDYGKLTGNFKYIELLRNKLDNTYHGPVVEEDASKLVSSTVRKSNVMIRIDGHLFDSGLIGQIFDLIEKENGEFHTLYLKTRVNTPELRRGSRLVLQIDMTTDDELDEIVSKLKKLLELVPKAQGTLSKMPYGASNFWQE